MTTPFGIRHVSSTTAGSCASPGLSAQKLYLYTFGMLPCTMMNNKISRVLRQAQVNTHVRWAKHHVRQDLLTSQGETRALSKISPESFMSPDETAAHPVRFTNGKRKRYRKRQETLGNVAVGMSLFTPNYDTTASLSLFEGEFLRVFAPRASPHICDVAERRLN